MPAPSGQKTRNSLLRTSLVRLGMLLILVFSAWLVWGSVSRLTLANRKLRQKSSKVAALADEVQRLERKMDAAEIARLEERFKEASDLLFVGPEECVALEKSLREQAAALGLDARILQGPTRSVTNGERKVLIFPMTIAVEPAPDQPLTNSPYQRVLGFTRMLQPPRRRVDLLELIVSGGSNSVRRAQAAVQLWSQEAKP
jgi:outer membrane murein-binding lipoprotein Lpp